VLLFSTAPPFYRVNRPAVLLRAQGRWPLAVKLLLPPWVNRVKCSVSLHLPPSYYFNLPIPEGNVKMKKLLNRKNFRNTHVLVRFCLSGEHVGEKGPTPFGLTQKG